MGELPRDDEGDDEPTTLGTQPVPEPPDALDSLDLPTDPPPAEYGPWALDSGEELEPTRQGSVPDPYLDGASTLKSKADALSKLPPLRPSPDDRTRRNDAITGSDARVKPPRYAPGMVLANTYRFDREIARGGMGIVFEGTELRRGQRVAIKVLLPDALRQPKLVARFLREARAIARLTGEHAVQVFDLGTDEGAPYIVMEYLEGASLADLTAEQRRRPIREVLDTMLQVIDGLAEVHAAGIIHRDLKPENVFVTRRPDGKPLVKILDFGVSKLAEPHVEQEASLTHAAMFIGTPEYMSPEQIHNPKTVDPTTDIWAVGVMLYELLTGHRPFAASSIGELLRAVSGSPPPPMRRHDPHIPEGLELAVMRCLESDATRRFQTVGELAAALEPFAKAPAHAPPPPASDVPNLGTPDSASNPGTLRIDSSVLQEATRVAAEMRAVKGVAPGAAPAVAAPAPAPRRARLAWVFAVVAVVAIALGAAAALLLAAR